MNTISRITVIDDDRDLRNLLQISLGIHGYEVNSFGNAEEFLAQESQLNPSDLYIIDINLGGMTGDALCHHLKRDAQAAVCMVLLISANPEMPQLASTCAADGFIFKPFSQKELVSKIQLLPSGKSKVK